MLIVILITSILLATSFGFFEAYTNQLVEGTQHLAQDGATTTEFSRLSSIIGSAQRPLGLLDPSGTAIDPLSLAGDQVVFSGSDGRCWRIYYRERTQEVRVASSSSCSDAAVKPVRGPNEKDDQGNWLVMTDPSNPRYDAALDDPSGSYAIASDVSSLAPASAPSGAPRPLQLLSYRDATNSVLPVDVRANGQVGASHASFYDDRANRSAVYAVEAWSYLSAGASARIHDLAHTETFGIH